MPSLTFDRTGEPAEVLRLADDPAPEPRPGEVRVRMLLAPVNPSDLLFVRDSYPLKAAPPCGVGFEGVGVVEASGGGLYGRWLRGRRVAVLAEGGTWRDRVTLPAGRVIPVSDRVSDERAASFFVNPVTATAMVERVLRVPAGAWLLQTAAGSVLGRMVIRLCKHIGVRTVNVVRRGAAVRELLDLGADQVLATEDGPFAARVRRLTGGGVRYALDAVGGATGAEAIDCLAERGRLLVYGLLSGEPIPLSPRPLMTGSKSVHGFWLADWFGRASTLDRVRQLRRVAPLVASGVLAGEVAGVYDITDYRAALTAAETPGRVGKVLLRF